MSELSLVLSLQLFWVTVWQSCVYSSTCTGIYQFHIIIDSVSDFSKKPSSFSTVHYCLSFHLQNPDSNMAELRLTKPAPEFKGQAVVDGEFKDISLANYKGKYLVLFFYPLDL